jgi:putative ubiquitin-RnfH superfamily antitoxin RatB of RatAB toxin-antitoxin module
MAPNAERLAREPVMHFEVLWVDGNGLLQQRVRLVARQAVVADVLEQLPEAIRADVAAGRLKPAIYGHAVPLRRVLKVGDRIELLGPVLLDVKAARNARVKAARARERGPYNRSFPGQSKPT